MSNPTHIARLEFRALLKEHGLRATAPRLAVMMALNNANRPLTHDAVVASLPAGAHDKASIWRVLSDLTTVGILRRMDLGDRIWRYEFVDENQTAEDSHPHFLCEACGVVSCLPALKVTTLDGELPKELSNATFQIRIAGTCQMCLAS
jgi:Fur family ferric uptake transcriptional regulator